MKRNLILIAIVFVFLAGYVIVSYHHYYGEVGFNRQRWEERPDERYKMLDSIRDQYKIVGMSLYEITNLLGEKDLFASGQGNIIQYYISPGIGDPEFLVIYFNQDAIAYKYKIDVS